MDYSLVIFYGILILMGCIVIGFVLNPDTSCSCCDEECSCTLYCDCD